MSKTTTNPKKSPLIIQAPELWTDPKTLKTHEFVRWQISTDPDSERSIIVTAIYQIVK